MSKVSFIGAGKLGLPTALAIESKGHDVVVFDPDPRVTLAIEGKKLTYKELRADELLANSRIKSVSLTEAVHHGDIIFVAVQTPHDPRYEGKDVMPHDRKDFDYSYLVAAVRAVAECIEDHNITRPVVINVISTVLPGTVRREVLPLLRRLRNVAFTYNPFFAAMGTVIPDFLAPEFVLVGRDVGTCTKSLLQLYASLTVAPVCSMTIESAELTKVMYNCWISSKIVLANTVMELCHKNGGDCDEVQQGLAHATRRLWSPAYTKGGMGDGGNCHPRDNIAMSWLAQQVELSTDPFRFVTRAREAQSAWLADLVESELGRMGASTPVVILGTAFKPETDQTAGSPALLLKNQLERRGIHAVAVRRDTAEYGTITHNRALFVIGCRHPEFADYTFPAGSTVIDPHRYIPQRDGIKVVHVGSNRKGR